MEPRVSDLTDIVRRKLGPQLTHIQKDGYGQLIVESDARTPHQASWVGICLEIAQRREIEKQKYKQYFWVTMANRIKDAQQFQFGEVEDTRIKEEACRAGPLIAQKHLSLPYHSVIYNYTLIPDPDDVPEEMKDERVRFSTLAVIIEKDKIKDPLPGPLLMAADFIFVNPQAFEAKKKFCMLLAGGVVFQSCEPEFKWKGEIVDEPGQKRNETLVSIADGVGSMSMILATRGIQTRIHRPTQKQQKARVKRQKSLIPIVTHVDTQKYYKAMENVEKGHHASPVPHLRRGHIRHLDEDRTTWVRDCIVNCRSLSDIQERDHYEVEVDQGKGRA